MFRGLPQNSCDFHRNRKIVRFKFQSEAAKKSNPGDIDAKFYSLTHRDRPCILDESPPNLGDGRQCFVDFQFLHRSCIMPSKDVSDCRLSIIFPSVLVATGLLAGGLLSGCSSSGPPRPKAIKAKGKVLYKGVPVAGASVAFLGDGNSVPALGRTDANGQFELTTSESGDGAVPGMHKVTVSKSVPPKSSAAPATGIASMEAAADAAKKRGDQEAPPDSGAMSLLPEKYAQASTSDLSFEVTTTGPNDFTIELKD
jgi:hypothetical protein